MQINKGRSSKRGPALAAITIAGAGAAAVIKREKIREVLAPGDEADPSGSRAEILSADSEPPVTRLPQPGIG